MLGKVHLSHTGRLQDRLVASDRTSQAMGFTG